MAGTLALGPFVRVAVASAAHALAASGDSPFLFLQCLRELSALSGVLGAGLVISAVAGTVKSATCLQKQMCVLQKTNTCFLQESNVCFTKRQICRHLQRLG